MRGLVVGSEVVGRGPHQCFLRCHRVLPFAPAACSVNHRCIWESYLNVLRRSGRSMTCTSRYSTPVRPARPGGAGTPVSTETSLALKAACLELGGTRLPSTS